MNFEKPEEEKNKSENREKDELNEEEKEEVSKIYSRIKQKPKLLMALLESAKKDGLITENNETELKSEKEFEIENLNKITQEEIERLENMGADRMTIEAVEEAAREQRKRLMKKASIDFERKNKE